MRLKYLIFMENFQKNRETLIKDLIKLTNRTPFVNLNPLSRHPGSAPVNVSRSLKKGQGATPKKGNFNARQPMSKGQPLDAATQVKKQKKICVKGKLKFS